MKENNVKKAKNISNIHNYQYKPEGQITNTVNELFSYSCKGNYKELKKLIYKDFQGSTLNLALKNLIESFQEKQEDYINCADLLLKSNIDMNYKFPKDNGSTLLITLAKKENFFLLKKILGYYPKNINYLPNNHQLNSKKSVKDEDDEEFLYYKNLLFQIDTNGLTFIHHLYSHSLETYPYNIIQYLYDEFPYIHDNKEEKIKKYKELIKDLINITNNEENNLMNLCLIKTWIRCILKIISINGYSNHINNKKNNYIHCAILSKNITCLKIILYYCSIEDLNTKNIDSLTPSLLASKLGYRLMNSIINEYQKNFNEESYKDHFYLDEDIWNKKKNSYNNISIDLLVSFQNGKYKSLYYELKEYKLIQSIMLEENSGGGENKEKEEIHIKISLIKIEWNILLTELKKNQTNYEDRNNNINNINNTNINNKSNKFSKKKIRKNDVKNTNNNNSLNYLYKNIINFYENIFLNEIFSSFKNNPDNKEMQSNNMPFVDILIYNKIIYYFKFGQIKLLIHTAEIYLTKIFSNNSNTNIYYSLTIYVNISFLLTEIFIYHGHQNIAEIIIESLEKYLYNKNNFFRSDKSYLYDDKIISNYLNNNEIFNPFGSWEEADCYSNFLKILINKDKTNEYLNNYKKIITNCKYIKELPIFHRLNILNYCVEIKKLYDKEDDTNIYTKLAELKSQGSYIEIYFYNAIGIIFLKKKNYHLSKLFFYKSLNKYIQILKYKYINSNNENEKEKFISFRIDYITAIKYNISLCHFYLKEYQKCIDILQQLLLYKSNQNNFFFYYRLGICYLQLYLNSNKKNYVKYFNKNIISLLDFDKNNSKNKKNKNEKSLSMDFDNDSTENLIYQFEVEYHEKNNKYDASNSRGKNNLINTNPQDNFPIKRLILRNSNKFFLKNESSNVSNNIYIDAAISHFKKIIKISKIYFFSNDINSIYKFYSNDNTNNNEEDINKNNTPKKKRIPSELLIDIYLNLLFCLSLKKKWAEMILYIKDFTTRKFTSNKANTIKILLYKLEAYVNLDNIQKSKEILNKLKVHKKIELSIFNKTNDDIITRINIKLYLYYSKILINLRDKNEKEIDANVTKLLYLVKNMDNIPYYIIDLIINVYLYKLDKDTNITKTKINYNNIILNLIKNKKTDLNTKK